MLLTGFLVGCVAAPAQLRSLHLGWELLLWARSLVHVAWWTPPFFIVRFLLRAPVSSCSPLPLLGLLRAAFCLSTWRRTRKWLFACGLLEERGSWGLLGSSLSLRSAQPWLSMADAVVDVVYLCLTQLALLQIEAAGGFLAVRRSPWACQDLVPFSSQLFSMALASAWFSGGHGRPGRCSAGVAHHCIRPIFPSGLLLHMGLPRLRKAFNYQLFCVFAASYFCCRSLATCVWRVSLSAVVAAVVAGTFGMVTGMDHGAPVAGFFMLWLFCVFFLRFFGVSSADCALRCGGCYF